MTTPRVDRKRTYFAVAIGRCHPRLAALGDLINANDGMHRNISPGHISKFVCQVVLGRIDDELCLFAENQLLDLDKTVQTALRNRARVDFENLALIQERNSIQGVADHIKVRIVIGVDEIDGGEGGIRTHVELAPPTDFESVPL